MYHGFKNKKVGKNCDSKEIICLCFNTLLQVQDADYNVIL